jgi:tetratricopeptide (TPR) repeat protein
LIRLTDPVPIDRTEILRNAEKLLRQGKLDQAIAEYRRIVEDQPSDWNTANVLGDLYVRASQTDKAIEQFSRIADHLHVEGFLPKAAAVYKKILKLKPDHEHAMLQAGEIAGRQGLAADARALFNAVTTRRRARGDERGVAEIAVRLASLDPNDFEARLSGARTRVTLDDVPGAIADLKALAAYMQEKERPEEARRALREAAELDPDDAGIRAQLAPPDVAASASEVFAAADESGEEPFQDSSETVEQVRSGAREALATLGRLLGTDPEPAAAGGLAAAASIEDPGKLVSERLGDPMPFEPVDRPVAPPAAKAVEAAPVSPARGRMGEIDLSVALDEIRRPSEPPPAAPVAAAANGWLDTDPPDEIYRQGLSLYEAGRLDEAIAPLKAASRTAKLRFAAASLVGRIHRERGESADAIEWLERAAQSPAPTPGEGHLLLFDLAEALEHAGETARALAICMELQADAGNYRDVAARIDRLAKVRARG